ncbi:MAG: hypothetical protein KAR44_12560 [Candidatus Aegiribacteria sp.]|nr:hypothetical protein [Candidatus Aegiribacteria sp.]
MKYLISICLVLGIFMVSCGESGTHSDISNNAERTESTEQNAANTIIGKWEIIRSTVVDTDNEEFSYVLEINADGTYNQSLNSMDTPGTYLLIEDNRSLQIELVPESEMFAIENYQVEFKDNGDLFLSELRVRSRNETRYSDYGLYSQYRRIE